MAELTAARVVTFGLRPGATVRADGVTLGGDGRPAFTLVTPAGTAPVRLRLLGAHNVVNALAAAAIAGELGMPVTEVGEGLSAATPRSKWRMEVTERADGVTVINDAYNANPEGMAAALETLATVARGRRAIAVLGPMNELGDESQRRHEEAGGLAARAGVAALIVVGENAAPMLTGAKAERSWRGELISVPDAESAVTALGNLLGPGDVVLVKASRTIGLERVALALTGEAAK
jgi:UDP-N-acetylmuramoyl-tripeptide--D-alanyl-D-alanine ligase